MGIPSGANSRPPCASKLCGPEPKYEFGEVWGDFLDYLALAAYSWNRILLPSGLVLPCIGWYKT